MNKIFMLILLATSVSVSAQSLTEIYYFTPLMLCSEETYLQCRNDETLEQCTQGLAALREPCAEQELTTDEDFFRASQCMVERHFEHADEYQLNCLSKVDFELTSKKLKKLKRKNEQWLETVLTPRSK